MYDPECERLAKYFLIDPDPPTPAKPTKENIESLAQEIQNAIEEWFTRKEEDYEAERDAHD